MFGRKTAEVRQAAYDLADLRGEFDATIERLNLAQEYEATKKELTDKQIELDRVREDHAREQREIEHKLGLHKLQVEQERVAAVTEAKLAVREEALNAQKGQFEQNMEFMRERFEQEVQATRHMVDQVLARLPHFEHKRVEHIGVDPNPPHLVELEGGKDA